MTQEQRYRALLELLFGAGTGGLACGLQPEDWQALMPVIREHRLEPILHWQLQQPGRESPVLPGDYKTQLATAFKRSTRRGLRLQAELVRVHRLLTEDGIPYAALKGAFVAFAAYPHCAMRPMRDLDILVPEKDALRAFALLQREGGYGRSANAQGDPESVMQIAKHLPPLQQTSRGICVEIHHRLAAPRTTAQDPAGDPSLWNRLNEVPIGRQPVTFLSPTETLLHLIMHAAYDHYFNNGPLILSDIRYLLQRNSIDWPLFWKRAQACKVVRGCQLTLAMAQALVPSLSVQSDASGHPVEPVLEDALNLLLRSLANRGSTLAIGELQQGGGQRWQRLTSRVLPSRTSMAARYPVTSDSIKVWLYYPVLWRRLIRDRLPAISRHLFDRGTQAEVIRLNRVRAWMED